MITGAARGVGAEIARRLAHDGASTICVDVLNTDDTVRQLPKRKGAMHLGAMVDVAESRAVTALVESVLARYGQIDVLVNNAAITHPMQPIVDISDDVIDHVFAVNVRGTIACSRAVGRAMCARGSGRIINIASQLGKAPWPGHAVYSASKAAVIALTQASALELAPNGVIVNCICPGTLVTDQMRATFADKARASGRDVNELIDEAAKAMPLGRMGKPEDVAALVAWLASEEASFIVGAAINLTGGESVAL